MSIASSKSEYDYSHSKALAVKDRIDAVGR